MDARIRIMYAMVPMYACMYVCLWVRMCVRIDVCTHVCVRIAIVYVLIGSMYVCDSPYVCD